MDREASELLAAAIRVKREEGIETDEFIMGMVIALTFMMGCPYDHQKAEAFINRDPYWEAL